MKEVKLEFSYHPKDYKSALWLYYRLKKDFIIAVVGLVSGFFLWIQLGGSWVWILLISVSSILALIVLAAYFLVPMQRFHQDPKYKDKYFLLFTTQEILFKTQNIDSQIQWGLYSKVLENEKLYLLVYGKNLFTIIPKRVFDSKDQEICFRDLLKENIPSFK